MIGVISGIIISTGKLKVAGQGLADLEALFESVTRRPQYWDFYRENRFQIELTQPEEIVMMAMKIKAIVRSYKSLDVRLALGLGEKSFSAVRIIESNGSAFTYSDELLDNLKARKQFLSLRSPWKEWDEEINTYLKMSLVIMDLWKPKTAQLVSEVLQHPKKSQLEIASLLEIQQAGVSQGLKRAHLSELKNFEIQIREKIKSQIEIGRYTS